MPLRRRALTLSNVITNVESRLRNVELRPAPRGVQAASVGTDSIVNGSITASKLNINAQKLGANTGSTGASSPNGYHSIIGVSIPETVNLHREYAMPVTITTSDAHGYVVGDVFSLYGVGPFPNTNTPWTITKVVSPDTFVFKPILTVGQTAQYSSGGLNTNQVYATVATKACDTTTATLTFSSIGVTAYFQVGDVVTITGVSTGNESFNGTFKLTYVSSDFKTIKYTFPASATVLHSTPVAVTGGKAYATTHKYHHVGDTYTDTSTTPPTVYVWDGTAWVDIHKVPAGVIVKDNINPGPPTGLSVSNIAATYNPNGTAVASCTLSWTAPAINADNTPITDLASYSIQRRYGSAGAWVTVQSGFTGTSIELDNLYAGLVANFQVFAFDSGGNSSTAATVNATLATPSTTIIAPSTPTLVSKLGTITVKWDGLNSAAASYDNSLRYIEVHQSTTNNFVPSSTTLIGTILGGAAGFVVAAGLAYSTTYYFCLVAVTTKGATLVKVGPSAYANTQVTPLVNTDLIAKSLTTWPFADSTVDVNALASGSVSASKILDGAVVYGKVAAGAIGADQIVANSIGAGQIAAGSITANEIAALSIKAGNIESNAITADKINVGAIDGKLITGATIRTNATGGRVLMDTSGITAYASDGVTSTFNVSASTGAVTLKSGVGGQSVEVTGGQLNFYDSSNNWVAYLSATSKALGIFNEAAPTGTGGSLILGTVGAHLSGTSSTIWLDDYSSVGTMYLSASSEVLVSGAFRTIGSITSDGGISRSAYVNGGTTGASINNNGTLIRTSSSARYKQDIQDISYNYESVLALSPKKFRLKDEAEKNEHAIFYPGFVAEEMAGTELDIFVSYETLPDGSKRPDGVRYAELTSALVSAVKHQDSIINELSARLASIESKIS
jgi:Chaperone of endosialidase